MKILFLTNHLEGTDGWSRVSLDFIREIEGLGHETLVLQQPVLDKPLKYLASPWVSFLTAFKVKKEISRFSPDVIHFMVEPYATILPFLGNVKAKTYLTCHGTYSVIPNLMKNPFKKKICQILSKSYFQRLTGIIAVSNYTKDYLLRYCPGLKNKIKVINNGINLEKHRLIDLSRKPDNKTKKILFVGAVSKERKGVLPAIEGCRHYRDNFSPDFVYDIVGRYDEKSHYHKNLLQKIKDYGLADKVFFQGKVTDERLEDFYLKADLFLMPSVNMGNNFEGFGLVFLEAAAKGVPCIGGKDSGCQEAILEGKTGYLVNPFDDKEIAQKIDLILNQKSINGKNCLLWSQQNDIKIKAKELINFYQS